MIRVGTYDVAIAPGLEGLGAAIPLPPGRCVVVTNTVVGPIHGDATEAALRAAGWSPVRVTIPDGEARKDVATWTALVGAILDAGVDRRTPIVALGGGVTGDIAGFAAATVLRGLPLVQVPTTLLAMVDSSVGGKTGVNTPHGKNLLGAFHPPAFVWAPLATLETLPDDELRCGLGEVVKHAVIAGEEALARCEADASALATRDPAALARAVADSVRTKGAIVAEDPLEQGRRAVLNLGHTVGHALEAVAGYGALRHGEAVALGLLAITRWTGSRGWCDATLPARIEALLSRLSLPTRPPPDLDPGALARAVGFDKKRDRGNLKVAVPAAPGRVELRSVPLDVVPDLVRCLYAPE